MLHSLHAVNPTQMNGITAVLQGLHDNPQALDLARDRFDAEDPPPPYSSVSSTQLPTPTFQTRYTPHEIAEILRKPLSNAEIHLLRKNLTAYPAFRQFQVDSKREEQRIDQAWSRRDSNHKTTYHGPDLIGRPGEQREKVMIRNCVRKRWEILGVWNSLWGIPGRVPSSHVDNPMGWCWKWPTAREVRGGYHELSWDKQKESWPPEDEEYPDERAVRLYLESEGRFPMTYERKMPINPNTNEVYITSRPWYRWELEVEEEDIRLGRIPEFAATRRAEAETRVRSRWEMNDAWKTSWPDTPGWKWKHESPSPEPEDPNGLDFSPSEVDALEAILPPTPPSLLHLELPVTEEAHRLFGDLDQGRSGPEQSSSTQPITARSKEDATVIAMTDLEDKPVDGGLSDLGASALSPVQCLEMSRAMTQNQETSFELAPSNLVSDKPRSSSSLRPRMNSCTANAGQHGELKWPSDNAHACESSLMYRKRSRAPRQYECTGTTKPPLRRATRKRGPRQAKSDRQSQGVDYVPWTFERTLASKPRRSARIARLPRVTYPK